MRLECLEGLKVIAHPSAHCFFPMGRKILTLPTTSSPTQVLWFMCQWEGAWSAQELTPVSWSGWLSVWLLLIEDWFVASHPGLHFNLLHMWTFLPTLVFLNPLANGFSWGHTYWPCNFHNFWVLGLSQMFIKCRIYIFDPFDRQHLIMPLWKRTKNSINFQVLDKIWQTFCAATWKNKSLFYLVKLVIEVAAKGCVNSCFSKQEKKVKTPCWYCCQDMGYKRLKSERLINLAQSKNHSINLNYVKIIVCWCSLQKKKIIRNSTLLFIIVKSHTQQMKQEISIVLWKVLHFLENSNKLDFINIDVNQDILRFCNL